MVFSDIPFLFFFLPAFLAVYFAVRFAFGGLSKTKNSSAKSKRKNNAGDIKEETTGLKDKASNRVLLLFSLFFYAWGEPVYILLMLFTTLIDYTAGRLMERYGDKKRLACMIIAVVINLSLLAFFKYADFLVGTANFIMSLVPSPKSISFPLPGIALPIGISFYTFQSMSYTIDRYRGDVKAQKNYLDYLTYVSMFPQLIAGPIVRYIDIERELKSRTITKENFIHGFRRFLIGLFRKILIANQIGALWDEIRTAPDLSVPAAWLGLLAFTLQLYYDFSAYSDMAIGLGKMTGFNFLENFDYPLSSDSMTDFWHRWHKSLSGWFRDYVYIPLGGNRVGVKKHLRNLFIVWFLTGLWHGAFVNYILWGLYHGLFLVLEKYVYGQALKKAPKALQHLYSILVIIIGFGIFYFESLPELGIYFSKLIGGSGVILSADILWYMGNYLPIILAAVIFSFPIYPYMEKKLSVQSKKTQSLISVFRGLAMCLLFLVTVGSMVLDTYNPFLYFRF